MSLKFQTILIYFFLAVLIFTELLLIKGDKSNDFFLLILITDLILFLSLAIYNINLCFNLIIMILPFKLVLFQHEVGIVNFDLYTAGIVLLSLVCVIKLFLGQIVYEIDSIDITLIIFNIICLTFFVTTTNIIRSGFIYSHTVFIPTLTYFIVRMLLNDEKKYSLFKFHFLLAITIMAIIGCIEFFQSGLRINSTIGSSIRSGFFFILAIFLLISIHKKKYIIAGIINFCALLFGFSRIYLISFFISPIFYFISKKGFARILFLFMAGSTLLFTIGFASIASDREYKKVSREFQAEHRFMKMSDIEKTKERLTDISYFRLSLYGSKSN